MKKITFILIANILLILSIAFSFDELSIFNFNINNYETVETTKEAENVLTSLKKMMSKVENGGMYYDLENSEEIPSFDNMTFLSKSEFKLDYSTRSTDAKSYLNRTLKAYFTDEGIHYMVDLYVAAYKKPEQYNSNGETIEADYEIFVTEKDIYINTLKGGSRVNIIPREVKIVFSTKDDITYFIKPILLGNNEINYNKYSTAEHFRGSDNLYIITITYYRKNGRTK